MEYDVILKIDQISAIQLREVLGDDCSEFMYMKMLLFGYEYIEVLIQRLYVRVYDRQVKPAQLWLLRLTVKGLIVEARKVLICVYIQMRIMKIRCKQ